jgi:hypothetical protein
VGENHYFEKYSDHSILRMVRNFVNDTDEKNLGLSPALISRKLDEL